MNNYWKFYLRRLWAWSNYYRHNILTIILLLTVILLTLIINIKNQRITFLETQVDELVTESFSHTKPIILEDL